MTHDPQVRYSGTQFADFLDSKITWTENHRGRPTRYVNGHKLSGKETFSNLLHRCRTGKQRTVAEAVVEKYLYSVGLTMMDFWEWGGEAL